VKSRLMNRLARAVRVDMNEALIASNRVVLAASARQVEANREALEKIRVARQRFPYDWEIEGGL